MLGEQRCDRISGVVSYTHLDALSYALGFRFLGKEFLKTSVFATLCMAGFLSLIHILKVLAEGRDKVPAHPFFPKRQHMDMRVSLMPFDSETSGKADPISPVSYTHLDVYKRQGMKDASTFAIWFMISLSSSTPRNTPAARMVEAIIRAGPAWDLMILF